MLGSFAPHLSSRPLLDDLANMKCSNQADIRLIKQMGVKSPKPSYVSTAEPGQKLRAGINVVLAMVRMKKAGRKWAKIRELGEGGKRGRDDVPEKRERDRRRTSGRR